MFGWGLIDADELVEEGFDVGDDVDHVAEVGGEEDEEFVVGGELLEEACAHLRWIIIYQML